MQHTLDWQSWFEAAQTESLNTAMRALFAELAGEIKAGGAICQASGRCCKFNSFDHLLYVTGMESAWLLVQDVREGFKRDMDFSEQAAGLSLPVLSPRAWPDGCLYQVDGLCAAHTARPLGCRVFFCQQGTEDWQQALYERYHERIKALHAELGLPYHYAEWRGLLDAGLRWQREGASS